MATEWIVEPLDALVEDILDRRGVTPTKLQSSFTDTGHRVISAKLIQPCLLRKRLEDSLSAPILAYKLQGVTPCSSGSGRVS